MDEEFQGLQYSTCMIRTMTLIVRWNFCDVDEPFSLLDVKSYEPPKKKLMSKMKSKLQK